MPEPGVKIIGVDFSGAGDEDLVGKTWFAEGKTDGKTLKITEVHPFSRKALTDTLKASDFAVAAMDFPFGVPQSFIETWHPQAKDMSDLWQKAAGMKVGEFRENVKGRGYKAGNEPLRVGDLHVPKCYSPLRNETNPNMVPMTFQGMRMLAKLWQSGKFNVPPLPEEKGKATLLEVMPGAVVRWLNPKNDGYKGGKKWKEKRRNILKQLETCSSIKVEILYKVQVMCVGNDDCLDSVVAAFAAALWHSKPGLFRHPTHSELQIANLEGWLYAPVFIQPIQTNPK